MNMKFIPTFLGYLKWHYSKAFFSIFSFWKNILFFLFHFFSIKSLLVNFFAPWKRLADNYPKRFNLQIYFFTFLLNMITRVIGMILRTFVLIVGIFTCLVYIIFLPLTIIIWLALPIIVVSLFIFGIILIFFS